MSDPEHQFGGLEIAAHAVGFTPCANKDAGAAIIMTKVRASRVVDGFFMANGILVAGSSRDVHPGALRRARAQITLLQHLIPPEFEAFDGQPEGTAALLA